ncbi:MAG: DUF1329 domain-containing protein [Candidatus Binataceae bacterium]|nr:DUF1329 domain-containing protein [Candidatus Binataceae bacterium]
MNRRLYVPLSVNSIFQGAAFITLWVAIAAIAGILIPSSLLAQAAPSEDTIPVGTKITTQNWQQYKQFMPEGLADMFAGQFLWKLPADATIEIGPTVNVPEPPTYVAASEKYGSQVRVVHLPNGHMDVLNYFGGLPFPDPEEPDKGYKVLANLWYSYRPHLNVTDFKHPVRDCISDRYDNMSCESIDIVYRQEGYNTDPGVPVFEGNDVWYTEWLMVEAPEQAKYTAQLTLFYKDNQKWQDEYVFVPSLRRSLRLSSTARCSPLLGSDLAQDDAQVSGFNGGIAFFNAQYLAHKKIIGLTGAYNYLEVGNQFPKNFYQPLMFPPPSMGQWQVRDVDVLNIQRVPSERAGYCYGKRILYIDSYYHTGLWDDLYDSNMKLWKVALLAVPDAAIVPGVPGGRAPGLDGFFTMWDIQNDHLTVITGLNEKGEGYFVNSNAPKEYQDYDRYATPSGLSEIMR